MLDYRSRIYDNYVQARTRPLAPDNIAGLKGREAYILKLIREHFPSDKSAKILDLGCGHGTLVYFARQAGYTNMRGVDISAEQVEAAKKLGIEGVELGDLMPSLAATPDNSLDVVIAFDLVEHFTRSEVLPLVDEVRRVLKPGGRWIIHCPNGESPVFGRVYWGDFTHEQAYTQQSMNQLLKSSGYSEVRCFEDTPIAHGPKSLVRLLLWKWVRFQLKLYVLAESGYASGIFSQNFLTVARK